MVQKETVFVCFRVTLKDAQSLLLALSQGLLLAGLKGLYVMLAI